MIEKSVMDKLNKEIILHLIMMQDKEINEEKLLQLLLGYHASEDFEEVQKSFQRIKEAGMF